jgi:predicted nucleic acid-binding protein
VKPADGGFVVDASVSLAWFFEDEASEFTERALDRLASERAWVPALWTLECANVLASAHRRGRIDAARRHALAERATRLPLRVDREPVTVAEIDGLAARFGLSAYDAAYLELAVRRSLALLTLDARLAAAASAAGLVTQTAVERGAGR